MLKCDVKIVCRVATDTQLVLDIHVSDNIAGEVAVPNPSSRKDPYKIRAGRRRQKDEGNTLLAAM